MRQCFPLGRPPPVETSQATSEEHPILSPLSSVSGDSFSPVEADQRNTVMVEEPCPRSNDTRTIAPPISLVPCPPTLTLPHPPTSENVLSALNGNSPVTMSAEHPNVSRTSFKIRGVDHHFTLFYSSGAQALEVPNPGDFAVLGDIYHHNIGSTNQLWVKETSGWVTGTTAHRHPILSDHRLHVVSPGQPRWVHKKTLTTYKGRDKRKG